MLFICIAIRGWVWIVLHIVYNNNWFKTSNKKEHKAIFWYSINYRKYNFAFCKYPCSKRRSQWMQNIRLFWLDIYFLIYKKHILPRNFIRQIRSTKILKLSSLFYNCLFKFFNNHWQSLSINSVDKKIQMFLEWYYFEVVKLKNE